MESQNTGFATLIAAIAIDLATIFRTSVINPSSLFVDFWNFSSPLIVGLALSLDNGPLGSPLLYLRQAAWLLDYADSSQALLYPDITCSARILWLLSVLFKRNGCFE